VFEVMMARLARGTTAGRYLGMGYSLSAGDETIASLMLDMHLRGASGRPGIEKVLGNLAWEYERRFDASWKSAVQ
jgi:hypothetical protein